MIIFPWGSSKILREKEQALTGLRGRSGKVALDTPLLAEEMLFDPIGQGKEAELRNTEDATRGSENVTG